MLQKVREQGIVCWHASYLMLILGDCCFDDRGDREKSPIHEIKVEMVRKNN